MGWRWRGRRRPAATGARVHVKRLPCLHGHRSPGYTGRTPLMDGCIKWADAFFLPCNYSPLQAAAASSSVFGRLAGVCTFGRRLPSIILEKLASSLLLRGI